MTTKDYIKIAEVLREFVESDHFIPGDIVDKFAETLHADNPRFSRDKFLEAVYKERG